MSGQAIHTRITVQPHSGFDVVPAGRYQVEVDGAVVHGVARADTKGGIAWVHARDQAGRLMFDQDSNPVLAEVHGVVRLVPRQ